MGTAFAGVFSLPLQSLRKSITYRPAYRPILRRGNEILPISPLSFPLWCLDCTKLTKLSSTQVFRETIMWTRQKKHIKNYQPGRSSTGKAAVGKSLVWGQLGVEQVLHSTAKATQRPLQKTKSQTKWKGKYRDTKEKSVGIFPLNADIFFNLYKSAL